MRFTDDDLITPLLAISLPGMTREWDSLRPPPSLVNYHVISRISKGERLNAWTVPPH